MPSSHLLRKLEKDSRTGYPYRIMRTISRTPTYWSCEDTWKLSNTSAFPASLGLMHWTKWGVHACSLLVISHREFWNEREWQEKTVKAVIYVILHSDLTQWHLFASIFVETWVTVHPPLTICHHLPESPDRTFCLRNICTKNLYNGFK